MQEANVNEVARQQTNVLSIGDLLGIPFTPAVDGVFLPSDVYVRVCLLILVYTRHPISMIMSKL